MHGMLAVPLLTYVPAGYTFGVLAICLVYTGYCFSVMELL